MNLDHVEWDYYFYQEQEDNLYQKWEEKEWKRRNGHPEAQKSGRKHQNRSEYQSKTMDLSWTIVWTNFGRTQDKLRRILGERTNWRKLRLHINRQ